MKHEVSCPCRKPFFVENLMRGLQAQAEEIVCAELIYAEENTNDSLSLPGK